MRSTHRVERFNAGPRTWRAAGSQTRQRLSRGGSPTRQHAPADSEPGRTQEGRRLGYPRPDWQRPACASHPFHFAANGGFVFGPRRKLGLAATTPSSRATNGRWPEAADRIFPSWATG